MEALAGQTIGTAPSGLGGRLHPGIGVEIEAKAGYCEGVVELEGLVLDLRAKVIQLAAEAAQLRKDVIIGQVCAVLSRAVTEKGGDEGIVLCSEVMHAGVPRPKTSI
ncbi:unnamed protein product [Prorocentrum cordatum]|uniref:Uncharacterized protein n=1 Tax=Prorocentrum cordatum TaxID=2364126 RepID=A0ABN9TD32_9DINO|nr:unnamed protein product [Polarella glacialis]